MILLLSHKDEYNKCNSKLIDKVAFLIIKKKKRSNWIKFFLIRNELFNPSNYVR